MKNIMGINCEKHLSVILLFDEQGTPTFRTDRETNSFLGIGVTYKAVDESNIFEKCDRLFGLSNSRPLKNNDIGDSRAIEISEIIPDLPLQIVINSLNLANSNFEQTTRLYEEIGNFIRQEHRKARKRPIAQILHSRILDNTLFGSITRFIELFRINSEFNILIDDWAIPQSDREIVIEQTSESLQAQINSLLDQFSFHVNILVSPLYLLSDDSKKKRFVDVIASIASRSFLDINNPRFSEIPLNNILRTGSNICQDITEEIIEFMRDFLDEILRE